MLRRSCCVLACAWVLWEQTLGMISGSGRGGLFTWDPLGAFDTKADCEKAKIAAIAAPPQPPPDSLQDKANKLKGAPQPKPSEKTSQPKRVCLPDTVNPK